MAEGKKGFDLGSLLMVLILLCMLVAGLWMTGKALDARFDEVNAKLATMSGQIRGDIAELRKTIQAADTSKAVAAPPAAPAKEAAKKKTK